jgi:hypothetical protein
LTILGSDILATPPWARISAGTRSRAMTATAPALSAIFACSTLVTSMITPPLSISARPTFVLHSADCRSDHVPIFPPPRLTIQKWDRSFKDAGRGGYFPPFRDSKSRCRKQQKKTRKPITILVHQELRVPWKTMSTWMVP